MSDSKGSQIAQNTVEKQKQLLRRAINMRALLISYPFPPWGGNTKRIVFQANYLTQHGHEVHVLAVRPSNRLQNYDESLIETVEPNVIVHRVFAGCLHHMRYRFSWSSDQKENSGFVRRLFERFLRPLSTMEWLMYGLYASLTLDRTYHFDVLYSHGDPYVGNLVGCFARILLRKPWVMYISDPRYFAPGVRNRKLLYVAEKLCLSFADHIVVNCRETMGGYKKYFPKIPDSRFTILTDGFNEQLYTGSISRQDRFCICFTGRLYEGHCEPEAFFDALVALGEEAIELWVCGPASQDFERLAKMRGLEQILRTFGNLPFEQVIEIQLKATVLLAFGRQRGYQVPGKLFEYFGARRPVLAIHQENNDVASKYVSEYRRGLAVSSNPKDIETNLRSLIHLWKEDRLDQQFNLCQLPEFSLSYIAAQFENLLKRVARMRVSGWEQTAHE